MWSIGCIFAELITRDLLFKVESELGLLDAIFKLLGSPSESTWPGFSELPNARNVVFKAQVRGHLYCEGLRTYSHKIVTCMK